MDIGWNQLCFSKAKKKGNIYPTKNEFKGVCPMKVFKIGIYIYVGIT